MTGDVRMRIAKCRVDKGTDNGFVEFAACARQMPEAEDRIPSNGRVFMLRQSYANPLGPLAIWWIHRDNNWRVEQLCRIVPAKHCLYILLAPAVLEWAHCFASPRMRMYAPTHILA